MFKKYLFLMLLVSNVIVAQERVRAKRDVPVLHQISNKEVVQSIYPHAVKVDKIDDFWYRIVDEGDETVGFAMSSIPYCKEVKGYNDLTPVLLITDKEMIIQKVAILSNWETLSYVRRLENKGFFNLWNGKSLKAAKEVQLDAYSGATITANAVKKNIDFLLNNGVEKLPDSD